MTKELLKDELNKIFEKAQISDCIKFFKGSSEKDRRPLVKFIISKMNEFENAPYVEHRDARGVSFSRPINNYESLQVTKAALFVSGSLTDLKKAGWSGVPGIDHIEELVKTFKPIWLDEWVEWLCNENPHNYALIRLLTKKGYCQRPIADGYTLGMILALGRNNRGDLGLVQILRNEPDILQDDIWKLFEVEGNGEFSLAAHDKCTHQSKSWLESLIELSKNGEISRDGLLDSSLNALDRDFAQFRASWFSRFHEALEPTLEERLARKDRYLFLLGSQIAPTVSMALKSLVVMNKKKEIAPKEILNHLRPALEAKAKSTVTTALKLLESVALQDKILSPEFACLAASAFIHESGDVQKHVLDLLDKIADKSEEVLKKAIRHNIASLAPSLQPRLSKWVDEVQADSSNVIENPYKGELDLSIKAVVPLKNLDELLATCSFLLENPENPIDFERVLDGFSRMGTEKPDDWEKRVAPLAKRAKTMAKREIEDPLLHYLVYFVISYADNENRFSDNLRSDFHREAAKISFTDVLGHRLKYLMSQILSGQKCPLVSAPTDYRGFICPLSLVERCHEVMKNGVEPHILDQVLALLRIGIEKRAEALEHTKGMKGEFAEALRFALGENIPIGPTASLWIAASSSRSPGETFIEVLKKHGNLGPDAAHGVTYSFSASVPKSSNYARHTLHIHRDPEVPEKIPMEHLSVLFHSSRNGFMGYFNMETHSVLKDLMGHSVCGTYESVVRWGATVWPGNLEPYFSEGVSLIDPEWSTVQWQVRAYFEPMLESSVPLGDMATLLIAVGLGAIEVGQKGIATEAFIIGIEDGRLDIDKLGDYMSKLITTGYIKISRWTKTLSNASSVSAQHSKAVRSVIQGALHSDPSKAPRELGGLIELLYELYVAAKERLTDEIAINYLQDLEQGGKAAKFAQKLLKL